MKPYLFLLSLVLIGSSCVTKKKYLAFQGEQQALVKAAEQNLADCQFQLSQLKSQLQIKETELQSRLREMQNKDGELTDKRNPVRLLEDQIALLKGTNASLLDRLSDLSVISKSGAESINKSLQAISEQSKYLLCSLIACSDLLILSAPLLLITERSESRSNKLAFVPFNKAIWSSSRRTGFLLSVSSPSLFCISRKRLCNSVSFIWS